MSNLEDILGISFAKGTQILHATNSSEKVSNGSIFFGLPGVTNHGSKYSKDALDHGASIVVHNDLNGETNNLSLIHI